ncbi:MAG TPA: peptidoglycan DD-metalloendopeptidase family protein [Miltoncostaeaceae bacterium]|nr:peptidoglycan DD-metalloendopeptidase family protein [Miltoncostaeaceae bacterium]
MRSLDLKPTEAQWLEGPDVTEVQRALGFRGRDVDGVYGPMTAAAVELWKWRFGFPRGHVNNRLGLQGRAWLLKLKAQPADFARRAAERVGTFPTGRGGVVPPLAVSMGHGSEFRVEDPEGAPAANGRSYHAAKDWFAPGGSPVRAPERGRVVEARRSKTSVGQVFGGTVKIENAAGRIWVMRHVHPRVDVGQRVDAGQLIATVVPWRSGPPHVHIELWKSLGGGYRLENMIDPVTVLR